LLFAAVLLQACTTKEIGPQQVEPQAQPVLEGNKVVILNEGNFGRGNASISAYFPANGTVSQNIFGRFNGNLPLGDVLQDMVQAQGDYFVSLNASGKIVALDTATWQVTGQVENLPTPRYLQVAGQQLFTSDLFSRNLHVLKLNPLRLDTSIAMPASTGKMTVLGNYLYIAAQRNLVKMHWPSLSVDTIFKLNLSLKEVLSVNNQIWLLPDGAEQVWRLNSSNLFESPISLPANGTVSFLRPSGNGNFLYYYQNQQIWQLPSSPPFTPTEVVNFNGQALYGFGVNPNNNHFYLADALDYNQASDIYHYNAQGALLQIFKGGSISNGFYFAPK
jgi:hypothetical protein